MEAEQIKTEFNIKDYKLGKMENTSLLSHIFLGSDYHKVIKPIVEARKGKTSEEIDQETVEIKLTVNGELFDVEKFLNRIVNHFDNEVSKVAVELVKEKTSERLREFQNKFSEMEDKVNTWIDEIDWKTDETV